MERKREEEGVREEGGREGSEKGTCSSTHSIIQTFSINSFYYCCLLFLHSIIDTFYYTNALHLRILLFYSFSFYFFLSHFNIFYYIRYIFYYIHYIWQCTLHSIIVFHLFLQSISQTRSIVKQILSIQSFRILQCFDMRDPQNNRRPEPSPSKHITLKQISVSPFLSQL